MNYVERAVQNKSRLQRLNTSLNRKGRVKQTIQRQNGATGLLMLVVLLADSDPNRNADNSQDSEE